jgi:hypothetical protein
MAKKKLFADGMKGDSMKESFEIEAEKVEIEGTYSKNLVRVNITNIDIYDLCDAITPEILLDAIGKKKAKEYFELYDRDELETNE